jgi:hypothetical protein
MVCLLTDKIGVLQNPLAYERPMLLTVSILQRFEAKCWTVTGIGDQKCDFLKIPAPMVPARPSIVHR